eukprot:scaffold125751_cov26-Prasinocladus_malaysianus.AAC.2
MRLLVRRCTSTKSLPRIVAGVHSPHPRAIGVRSTSTSTSRGMKGKRNFPCSYRTAYRCSYRVRVRGTAGNGDVLVRVLVAHSTLQPYYHPYKFAHATWYEFAWPYPVDKRHATPEF